jgi:hypothetical protein
MTTSIFELASKAKLRFTTHNGSTITTEDLWDLPLQSKANRVSLDSLAKGLYKELKEEGEVSFVGKSSAKAVVTELKFDLVKHIIDIRLAEAEKAKTAMANKQQREKIMSILADKEDEQLKGLTTEQLKAML